MKFAHVLIAGTALVSSTAFAVVGSGMHTETESQPSSAQVIPQESQSPSSSQDMSQSRDNPWFTHQGQENSWSSAARGESNRLPSTEPSTALSEPSSRAESSAMAEAPSLSESDSPSSNLPSDTSSPSASPVPNGLGTDMYRS